MPMSISLCDVVYNGMLMKLDQMIHVGSCYVEGDWVCMDLIKYDVMSMYMKVRKWYV